MAGRATLPWFGMWLPGGGEGVGGAGGGRGGTLTWIWLAAAVGSGGRQTRKAGDPNEVVVTNAKSLASKSIVVAPSRKSGDQN